MQVEDRAAVPSHVIRALDEKLDRVLVVEDHLRLADVPALGRISQFDQAFRVEQGIGIAFETARIPGEIDEYPIEDPPGMGSRGLRHLGQLPHTVKPCPFFGRQVGADVRMVVVQELAPIANPRALTGGPRQVSLP